MFGELMCCSPTKTL